MFINTSKKKFDPSSIDPNQKASYKTVKLCAYKLTEAYNRATDSTIDYGTAFKWLTANHPHTDPKKNLKHGKAQLYIDTAFKMPKKMVTQLDEIHATKKPSKPKKPLDISKQLDISKLSAEDLATLKALLIGA